MRPACDFGSECPYLADCPDCNSCKDHCYCREGAGGGEVNACIHGRDMAEYCDVCDEED